MWLSKAGVSLTICFLLGPVGGQEPKPQSARLPPEPPLEEIAALSGPPVNVAARHTVAQQAIYYSPGLRRWITPHLHPVLNNRPIWICVQQRPAGELLHAVAAASNSVVRVARNTVVITESAGLENWLTLGRENLHLDPAASKGPLVFDPAQIALLDAGQKLGFSQMRQDLQDAMRSMVWQSYAFIGGSVGPEALTLADVHLVRQQTSEVGSTYHYALKAPSMGGFGSETLIMLPPESVRPGRLVRRPSSEPPGELPPSITGVAPDHPKMEHPDLAADAALQGELSSSPGEATVGGSLLNLIRTSGLNVIAITSMGRRPFTLPAQPLSTGELMRLIADEMAARWGKLGETYVLLPDPRLEREGEVDPRVRQRRLDEHLAALIRDIGSRGREILERTNYLRPRQFNKEQRFALEKIVRMAIVTEPRVSPRRALSMEETRLVYVAAEGGRGTAGLELRDRTGQPLIVSQVPLE